MTGSVTLRDVCRVLAGDRVNLLDSVLGVDGRAWAPDEVLSGRGPQGIDQVVADVTYDSRQAGRGSLFACKGATFKEDYLLASVAAGATAYLSQRDYPGVAAIGIVVRDVRAAMAHVADLFFGHPSQRLSVVAITGTKGKTSTAFMVDSILRRRPAGPQGPARSGLITGVVMADGVARVRSHNTTPEAIPLQRTLRASADNGCDALVMEASSQGLKYDRTLCCRFEVAVFTNIGEDHISPQEHPDFADYFASKLRIFKQARVAVVNLDGDRADQVLERARRDSERVLTYSASVPTADYLLTERASCGDGYQRLAVRTPRGDLGISLHCLGSFNASNALAAIAAAQALGVDDDAIARGLEKVTVPGRMETYVAQDGALVGIVDYAHNEMSMRALLRAAREEFPGREVSVVFGSVGTKAFDRREGLGRAAGKLADRIYITEDEPGDADVVGICEEIGEAVRSVGGQYVVQPDRELAVRQAIRQAARPAVVCLAGKGTEDTMYRAHGDEPYGPDARIFCEQTDLVFEGYGLTE